jgi:hypothetical protein
MSDRFRRVPHPAKTPRRLAGGCGCCLGFFFSRNMIMTMMTMTTTTMVVVVRFD